MARLIEDAALLTDVQAELGITVESCDDSFGNIVNAISVMQAKMGIAGTTVAEASETISGSMNAMKAAWQNFLVGLADSNQDMSVLFKNLYESGKDVAENLFPRIAITLKGIWKALKDIVPIIDEVAIAIGTATAAMLAFKAGAKIQGIINAFQQARVSLALYSATMKGATVAQGVMNGTLTATETIMALLTGKITLAELATILYAKAQAALNAVMAANPIGIVILAITALVAAFVILWKKSEKFRNFWMNLWETIKTKSSEAKDKLIEVKDKIVEAFQTVIDFFKNNWKGILLFIVNPFAGAFALLYKNVDGFRDKIKAVIDKIKSFFNTTLKFKGIKLPKIKLTLEKGTGLMAKAAEVLGLSGVPKFSVKWNAAGAVFNKPAILNSAYGFQGVGEAGAEAVAPISTLQAYVSEAVASQNEAVVYYLQKMTNMLADYFPQVVTGLDRPISIDADGMASAMAVPMDKYLGRLKAGKDRGR